MRVLVIGATGLVGRHVLQALHAAGWAVVGASRRCPPGVAPHDWRELDFGHMTASAQWLPLLQAVDAVVNAVGIIRETQEGDFDRLHRAAPVALFAACEQMGLRVVQVSALGSDPQAGTGYWRSKGAAEADLLGRRMDSIIIRPSLVYGEDGASSVLFRMLATLPVLMLPAAHRALVQPIHVADLADIVVRLLTTPGTRETLDTLDTPGTPGASGKPGTAGTPSSPNTAGTVGTAAPLPRTLAVVGPRATTIAGYLADLRAGMQAPAALVLSLPAPVARVAARLAALIPSSALTPESLRMLEQSADGANTADAAPAQAVLGRPLRDPRTFATPAQRVTAAWSWGAPLVTVALALMWLVTAYVSWFGWSHAESRSWLAACGVPAAWQEPMLLAASITDGAIGVLLLVQLWQRWWPQRWLWAAQLALVGGYTVMLSVFLPDFWRHPFGPLTKNLPLLALMLLLWRASPVKNRRGN